MKQTNKEESDRRMAERRAESAERREDATRALLGERRVVDNRGVGAAMVDALADILRWERASERAIRVEGTSAAEASASS